MGEWSIVFNISFVAIGLMFILFSVADVNSSSHN